MDIKDIIAKNIKSIRKEKWIGQEKLADLAGIHRTHISLIERGQSNMTIEILDKISKALSVEIQMLVKKN